MGKLYKRGATYWADYWTREGQRVRESLKTQDKKVAKERLRAAELGDQARGATHPEKRLGHAVDDMIALKRDQTAITYKAKAKHLFRVFGADCDINQMTRADVADYCAQRLKEKAKRHTIHKELVCLRQSLKEAKERKQFFGTLDIIPTWQAEYEPKRRWLTVHEFRLLLAAVKPDNRTWVVLEVYTSSNLSETRRMKWGHIDFAAGKVTVPGTKRTSRYRVVPMHPHLRAWLERQDRTKPLVQPWKAVAKDLRAACKAAGIDGATTNDLRRTFGSWLKQAGVDSTHIAKMMGHNSTTMVDRVYGQVSDDSLVRAMEKMPGAGAMLLLPESTPGHTPVTPSGSEAE